MQSEIEGFIDAQNLICEKSNLSLQVFIATNKALPNDSEAIYDLVQISLSSPFVAESKISKSKVIEILKNSSTLALQKVSEESVISSLEDKDEVLIIFDILLVDFVFKNYGIHIEEFKALITSWNLLEDTQGKSIIKNIVEKI